MGFSSSLWVLLAVVGAWFLIVAFLYRGLLYDEYENFCLSSAQCVAGILRLDLIGNVGHAMYEARRAVQEHRRKGIDLDAFHDILIFIEDRQFYEHSGLSLRGYGRAITSFLGYRRRSGGSTITQQLARTLLIMEFSKTVRRKILEIPLAWWLEKTLSKGEILNLHLVSVRFAYGRNGVLDALNHFFGSTDKRVEDIQLSEARRFFLIERISNVRNDVLAAKIDETLRQARSHGVIADSTPSEVVRVYKEMIDHDILNPQDSEAVERLFQKWRRPQ